jgi:hypothetical protein
MEYVRRDHSLRLVAAKLNELSRARCRKQLAGCWALMSNDRMSWDHFRPYVSFIVVTFFLTFMFISGILEEVKKHDNVQPSRFLIWFDHPKLTFFEDFPDFSHYTGGFVQNVPDDLFPIGLNYLTVPTA